jgi:tetratricopeptide (TPR) repeat protein
VWDLNTGKLLSTLEGHTGPVYSVAISPDNTKIVSGSGDNTIRVWDLQSNKYYFKWRFDCSIHSINFFHMKNMILITDTLGNIYLASIIYQWPNNEINNIKSPIEKQQHEKENDTLLVKDFFSRGKNFYHNHQFVESIEYFDKVLDIDPSHIDAYYSKGTALNELERYEEAIEYFDKVLDIDPSHSDAWHSKGTALNELERYEEAIECFDRETDTISHNPFSSLDCKGLSLYHLKRYEEAIECFDRSLDSIAGLEGILGVNTLYYKALSLTFLERYEEAIECFDKVLKFKPDFPLGWILKGYALGGLIRYEQAIECYDKALEIKPNDETALTQKQLALDKLRETKNKKGFSFFRR